MTMQQHAGSTPQAVLTQMINAKCASRCVSLAAELAIADLLVDGPKDVETMGTITGTNPDALYRVLRMLAGIGVFVELPGKRFQNNPLSEALSSISPTSVRNYARWFGLETHWRMWAGLEYSVHTGKPWVSKDHPGKMPFDVLAERPTDQEVFNGAMTDLSTAHGSAIVQAYDFSEFDRIVEVGGGHGALATLIVNQTPRPRVTIFDLPQVIEGTRKWLSNNGLLERIDLKSGSFFDSVPGPADLCVLKHVLHDWDDESARRILKNCRQSLSESGRVLVCEMLIAEGAEGIPALILDIEMLVGAGGRERTQGEFSELFAAVGMRLNRVLHTPTPVKILEAVPAG